MLKDYEDEFCSNKIEHKTKVISKSFTVGVEMMIHKGGRICYGMLVAQMLPYNETNAVKVSIAYTREKITQQFGTLVLYNEEGVFFQMNDIKKVLFIEREHFSQAKLGDSFYACAELIKLIWWLQI